MGRPLINVPGKLKRGQVFEIKTLISHIMETGFRYSTTGQRIPRDIITSFSCRYNGEEVFSADFYPAVSANPFLSFFTTATESGTLEFTWVGDNGYFETAKVPVTVE
jgi:sulfur-oxidizing protein SoxZ